MLDEEDDDLLSDLKENDLKDDLKDGPNGNAFWWSVELEAVGGVDAPEEMLLTVADLSGSIGSEIVEEDGKTVLRVAYRASENIEERLSALDALLKTLKSEAARADPNARLPELRVRAYAKLENRPWHRNCLESFPPLPVGMNFVISAPWHRDKWEKDGKVRLCIYPGAAFGTGCHESTQIALEFIERFVKKGDTIVDVGTGSGVLFIAALKLGAAGAVARDFDPVAITEALRNMRLNDLPAGLCDLATGNLLAGVKAQADILTANILLDTNLRLLPDVQNVLKPDGIAVFSGMTVAERSTFLKALSGAGMSLIAELTRCDWWGCAAVRILQDSERQVSGEV